AFATWAGGRLPTEIEWERAARGGEAFQEYAWGAELHPNGAILANTWQGRFPYENTGALGHCGTAPVGSFPPNGYGLFDMIGNVWEWTSSTATADHRAASVRNRPELLVSDAQTKGCGCGCGPSASVASTSAPATRASRITKGGSHLCSPDYCQRYRPAARSARSEEHTSELQSRENLVCRLLL